MQLTCCCCHHKINEETIYKLQHPERVNMSSTGVTFWLADEIHFKKIFSISKLPSTQTPTPEKLQTRRRKKLKIKCYNAFPATWTVGDRHI